MAMRKVHRRRPPYRVPMHNLHIANSFKMTIDSLNIPKRLTNRRRTRRLPITPIIPQNNLVPQFQVHPGILAVEEKVLEVCSIGATQQHCLVPRHRHHLLVFQALDQGSLDGSTVGRGDQVVTELVLLIPVEVAEPDLV